MNSIGMILIFGIFSILSSSRMMLGIRDRSTAVVGGHGPFEPD